MASADKTYLSKVLLFGEYTVLHGSKALAMPFDKYSGRWIMDKQHDSRRHLEGLKSHLIKQYGLGEFSYMDFDEMEYQITKGLAFDSNIPLGYGVGSSGSVTAAIFDRFAKIDTQLSIPDLQRELGLIESCFHGSSSGLDPLVSFMNQPILQHSTSAVELIDKTHDQLLKNLYLIDTCKSRRTKPLVESYKETRRSSENFIMETQAIAEQNDQIIDIYLQGDEEGFKEAFLRLSALQYTTLKMMIPPQFQELWQEGLDSKSYAVKLNGAGGGGFLMLMVLDNTIFEELDQELILVPLI